MATEQSAELEAQAAECRRLTEALVLAERDREHWAFELHDSVLQDLTAAAMLLEGARQRVDFQSDEARDNFAGGLRLLREAMAEARRLIHGATIVAAADRGFSEELSDVVRKARRDWQLPVTLDYAGQLPEPPPAARQLLLRIVQEALHNAWKHAGANEVEVRVFLQDGCLELAIADNGVGFDPAQVPPGRLGLDSMRARAKAAGAEIVFDTAPQHGTRVRVRLRLEQT